MPLEAELDMPPGGAARAGSVDGYVRHTGQRMASVQMTPEERILLREVADAAGLTMSEVLRRGLRLFAAHAGGRRAEERQ
jgi:hypothetical protein